MEKRYENQDYIKQFINICRKNFLKDNPKQYKILIADLIDWLYIRDNIKVKRLKIFSKKISF